MGFNELKESIDDDFSQITLTDGTQAVPAHYPYYVTEDGAVFIPDFALIKKTITDERERYLYHNGDLISSNKRYDGFYCCGEYLLCTYVEDDYLSGWKNQWFEWLGMGDTAWGVDRKWTPNPGWGDRLPPPASDRAAWDYYKACYPGFAVDVFCRGEKVGTFKLSDANSPILFDRLGIGIVWLLFAARQGGNNIGSIPWALEGTPKCRDEKLLIPFDGGITTCLAGGEECRISREVFP